MNNFYITGPIFLEHFNVPNECFGVKPGLILLRLTLGAISIT
jgi:small neutral amino acid transporter SnatA (MarC family)